VASGNTLSLERRQQLAQLPPRPHLRSIGFDDLIRFE
jgi:hypothetical protein